jgi:hypothetical protein
VRDQKEGILCSRGDTEWSRPESTPTPLAGMLEYRDSLSYLSYHQLAQD